MKDAGTEGVYGFLDRVSTGEEALISPELASEAAKAWKVLQDWSQHRLPVPCVAAGPDGMVLYSWDRGRHHLELEFVPNAPAEFFYEDRETRELWLQDYNAGDPLPREATDRLAYFIGAAR